MDINTYQAQIIKDLEIFATLDLEFALAHAAANPSGDLCTILVKAKKFDADQAEWIRTVARQLKVNQDLSPPKSEATLVVGPSHSKRPNTEDFLQYQVLETISQGTTSEVYRAYDKVRHTEIALKLLRRGKRGSNADIRFRQEAAILARVAHPNIIRTFEFGVENDQPYLAMELIRGSPLSDWREAKGGRRSWSEIGSIFRSIASALRFLHQLGVMHRDLTPANILVEEGSGRAVLIDLGLAKPDQDLRRALGFETLTRSGQVLGTPAFMSPEQLAAYRGKGVIATPTDVWSFGATLFYVVTGEAPYASRSAIEQFVQLARDEPRRLRGLIPDVPQWLDDLCHACLRRAPEDRVRMVEILLVLDALGVA